MRCNINGHVRSLANGRVQIGVDPYGKRVIHKTCQQNSKSCLWRHPYCRLEEYFVISYHLFMISAERCFRRYFCQLRRSCWSEVHRNLKSFLAKIMSASFAQSSVKDIQRFLQGC